MLPYGQSAGFPPGFNSWPDFQKLSWYAIEFEDKLSEILSLNNHVSALQQKEQDALQDAYEFQDKAREWEKKYEETKQQMDRLKTELPTEIIVLRQTVKKAEKEVMLLQWGVAKRDESIQKLRSRLISAKEEYKTEIKLLDDIVDERNNEVNQLRENELGLKAEIQALDDCWKLEKERVDKFKIEAENYDEAGPALGRLKTILAKYLGDQLQDGLDWPPGHPNNKASINRALDALDNELRKASLKPALSAPLTPTTISRPSRAIDGSRGRNRVNSAGSSGSFHPPNFLGTGQRRRSDTDTSRNSMPPNTDMNLGAELEGHSDLLSDDGELYDSHSSIDTQRTSIAIEKKKEKGLGNLADHTADVLGKGVKDFEEVAIGVENQTPISAGRPPYNPSDSELARTPTNGKERPVLGLGTSTGQGNASRRIMSMFGNGTAPPEDDSPKPSNKVFADDRKQRGSRFVNKPMPSPEPVIEYRDKIIYKNKIIEILVPMQCTKAHVEDQPAQSPMIIEVEKKVMVPCSRDHLTDHTCPIKEVEVVKGIKVPYHLDHIKDHPPSEIEVPIPCTKPHLDQHFCPALQTQQVEKLVETPVEVFVDRPIIQEKIVNKYINTTVYGSRNPLWTIFYIYFDLWTILIAWMNQKSAFTYGIVHKFYSHLPDKYRDWCITDPLIGRTFEVIDVVNTHEMGINGRAALLKATKKSVESFDAETAAQNFYNEQLAKNETKNVPININPQPTKVDCKGKGKVSVTAIGCSTSALPHKRKSTPLSPQPRDENYMRSTHASQDHEAEYVLATHYVIRRPPLFSNLLMGIFFLVFFVVFFLAACIVREYSSFLQLQGIIRPSWFTQPWLAQEWGGASLRSRGGHGFVVDQDWNCVRYLWEAVARFGWLRQVHFWLETTASGGAGYRMPG